MRGHQKPHVPRDQTNEGSYYKFLSLDDRYVLFSPFMLSYIANCEHKDKSWLLKFCSTGSVMIWMILFKPQHHSISSVGGFLTVHNAYSH